MSSRRGLISAVAVLALLSGCATGRGGAAAPSSDQSVVCRAPDGVTMQRSADDCLRVVRALDKALSAALTPLLPATATISNNSFGQDGAEFGGSGVQFHRTLAESGMGERYETSVRIRDGGTSFNLRVELVRYDHLPAEDRCAVEAATPVDRTAKGIVTVECGQTAATAGTVFREVTGYPYGAGDFAKLLTPTAVVELYRTGGELVRIAYETVVEKTPTDRTPGMLPMKLSMDQLVGLAKTPDLTVG